MHNFYYTFQIIGAVILGILLTWFVFNLKPIDSEEDKKAHSKS